MMKKLHILQLWPHMGHNVIKWPYSCPKFLNLRGLRCRNGSYLRLLYLCESENIYGSVLSIFVLVHSHFGKCPKYSSFLQEGLPTLKSLEGFLDKFNKLKYSLVYVFWLAWTQHVQILFGNIFIMIRFCTAGLQCCQIKEINKVIFLSCHCDPYKVHSNKQLCINCFFKVNFQPVIKVYLWPDVPN